MEISYRIKIRYILIDIDGCKIGDKGCGYLSQPNWTKLTKLFLSIII